MKDIKRDLAKSFGILPCDSCYWLEGSCLHFSLFPCNTMDVPHAIIWESCASTMQSPRNRQHWFSCIHLDLTLGFFKINAFNNPFSGLSITPQMGLSIKLALTIFDYFDLIIIRIYSTSFKNAWFWLAGLEEDIKTAGCPLTCRFYLLLTEHIVIK